MRNLSIFILSLLIAAFMAFSCTPTSQPDTPDNPGDTEEPNNPGGPDNPEDSLDDQAVPVIELADGGQISFTFEGGEATLGYTVKNPVEGGVVTVSVPEKNTWLTATVLDTCISLAVTENNNDEARNEMLAVVYTYGDEFVKSYINIIQDEAEYDYVIDASNAVCTWYGNPERKPEMTNYNIILKTADGVIVSLDLLAPEKTEDMLAPVGEYNAVEFGSEEGLALSIGGEAYSYLYKVTPDFEYEYDVTIDLGSVVNVSREDNTFTIKASLIAYETGQTFLIRYTGEMEADNGFVNSSLKEDFSKTYNAAELGVYAEAVSYSQAGVDVRYWVVYIGPDEYKIGDPGVFMEFFTTADATTTDKLGGIYTADPDYEVNMTPNTFIPGSVGYSGTWFTEVGLITDITAYAGPEAPIMAGTIELKLRPNLTYDLTIDGYDDNYESPKRVQVKITNIDFGLND